MSKKKTPSHPRAKKRPRRRPPESAIVTLKTELRVTNAEDLRRLALIVATVLAGALAALLGL